MQKVLGLAITNVHADHIDPIDLQTTHHQGKDCRIPNRNLLRRLLCVWNFSIALGGR